MNTIASSYDLQGMEALFLPLERIGWRIKHLDIRKGDPETLIKTFSGYPYIIAAGEFYNALVLEALHAKGLRMIIRLGVGYDHIDIVKARELGIDVANTPGANAESVAEHALMLTLAVARHAGKSNAEMHRGEWIMARPKDLFGKTFGLIGFGNIARRYAALVRPMAGRIAAYDSYPNLEAAAEAGVELLPLSELLRISDVISLHLPLTDETHHMFDNRAFSCIKKGAILVNTSRGAIIDENALCEALDNGTLMGAGLDVFSVEPIDSGNPLTKYPNCIMTPHNASLTDDAFKSMTSAAVEGLLAHITGAGRLHVVN